MKDFKYDTITLLQAVGERPCIWDKTLDNYKDRFERKTAWEEIFTLLEPRFPNLSAEDKREIGNGNKHTFACPILKRLFSYVFVFRVLLPVTGYYFIQ